MSNVLKLDFANLGALKGQRGSGVLGLALDGGRLEGVVLRRTNGSVQVQQSFSVTLSLDPLTNDPELVGREIRNHLDAAGVRERRCVVGLPLKWALTAHTKLPDLPEADIASFLQIEAERGFPCDVATLMFGVSRYETRSGEHHATLVGIPRNHVTLLERVLRAAQLRPASFSLGLAALQPAQPEASNGVLALTIGESHVGLQITCGAGIAALRALEGALDSEGGQRQLHADVVAREARITLAQLPADVREAMRAVRIFGPRDLAQQLADEIELRLESMALKVELVSRYSPGDFGVQFPSETPVTPAFSLAVRYLAGSGPNLEFLPPKISAWQQLTTKYSSGKLQQAGVIAAAVAVLVGGAFGIQQWQLWRLQSQWGGMSKTVGDIQDMQAKIKQFRPWYDESIRGLTILRRLTEAFPEDGTVTAKTIEIRDLSAVTCSGVASDYQGLLRTLAHLRTNPQMHEVALGTTRGQAPAMQFTFNFVWSEGGANAD
jgi:hypothetical protein